MRISWRRTRASALVAAMTMLAIGRAGAEQVAPYPIEAGEWYLGVAGGVEYFGVPTYKSLQLYQDDRSITGTNEITVTGSKGYMIEHDFHSLELVPAIHFGYGFGKDAESGVWRLEFSVNGMMRDESSYQEIIDIPSKQYNLELPDGSTQKVSAFPMYRPIDGKDNKDDTDATYWYSGPVYFESFEIEEKVANGDINLYFDTRKSSWLFSRGMSLGYQYFSQDIQHEYATPLPLLDPAITDVGYYFAYSSVGHSVTSKFHYSVGYEMLPGWSVFTNAKFGVGFQFINLEGSQNAPCLQTCDLADTYTRGTREIDINDTKFHYDVRLGLGSSGRLGPFRLTINGGGTYIGGWTTPRETESGVELATSSGFGYFGRVSLDIAF
jgi:hypothetical protein